MKNIIMLIGLSGSGKSFYLKNRFLNDFPEINSLLEERHISLYDIVVCPDNIRKEITGDISNHDEEVVVWDTVKTRMRNSLENYDNVVLDATNLSERGKVLKGLDFDNKIAVIFQANPDLSKKRISNDLKNSIDRSKISDYMIDNQLLKFKKSIVGNEKWDGVWNDKTKEKIRKNLKSQFKIIYFFENI